MNSSTDSSGSNESGQNRRSTVPCRTKSNFFGLFRLCFGFLYFFRFCSPFWNFFHNKVETNRTFSPILHKFQNNNGEKREKSNSAQIWALLLFSSLFSR